MSDAGPLDTLPPRIELLAPEPGAAFYGGELEAFRWRVTETHAPALEHPLQFAVRIEGAVVHVDSLPFIPGAEQSHSWLVPDVITLDCRWELRIVDGFGNLAAASQGPHPIVVDGTPAEAPQPTRLELVQNYPNPFNPSTRLRFALPRAGSPRLSIHDVTGREIARLWDGPRAAGWWELEWHPERAASGIYFARLSLDGLVITRKLVLLK